MVTIFAVGLTVMGTLGKSGARLLVKSPKFS